MEERKLISQVERIIRELHGSLPATRTWGAPEWTKHFASLREIDEAARSLSARPDAELFLARILTSLQSPN